MDDQTRKRIEKAIEEMKKESNKEEEKITGGIIIPMSQCCGVPLRQTTGGIIMDYCPKCGGMHQESRY